LAVPVFAGQERFAAVEGNVELLPAEYIGVQPIHGRAEGIIPHHWAAVRPKAVGALRLTGHGREEHELLHGFSFSFSGLRQKPVEMMRMDRKG
jgi:hypothetical protein